MPRGRLLACCAHSTVAARVEARLATGGMGLWLPWIVSASLTLVLGLGGGGARRCGLGRKGAWGCVDGGSRGRGFFDLRADFSTIVEPATKSHGVTAVAGCTPVAG